MKELTKEKILNDINEDALRALCAEFDEINGEYPEHRCEGAALFSYFLRLKKGLGFKTKELSILKEEKAK